MSCSCKNCSRDHPTLARVAAVTKKLGVVFERANNAYCNSVAIIDADGRQIGVYRKSHIPDGVGICWDQWFAECARSMALQGAKVLFYPTAIGSEPQDTTLDSRDHWRRVMQGHAGANLMPVMASNRIGHEQGESCALTFYGNSFIAGGTGELIEASGDASESVLVASFDLDKLQTPRAAWGLFRDRRPDLYRNLMTTDGGPWEMLGQPPVS